jgi:hypothetical protein
MLVLGNKGVTEARFASSLKPHVDGSRDAAPDEVFGARSPGGRKVTFAALLGVDQIGMLDNIINEANPSNWYLNEGLFVLSIKDLTDEQFMQRVIMLTLSISARI